MIVLCCPKCRADVPERDLGRIIRFYDGDSGLGVECPSCAQKIVWEVRVRCLGS